MSTFVSILLVFISMMHMWYLTWSVEMAQDIIGAVIEETLTSTQLQYTDVSCSTGFADSGFSSTLFPRAPVPHGARCYEKISLSQPGAIFYFKPQLQTELQRGSSASLSVIQLVTDVREVNPQLQPNTRPIS